MVDRCEVGGGWVVRTIYFWSAGGAAGGVAVGWQVQHNEPGKPSQLATTQVFNLFIGRSAPSLESIAVSAARE